MGIVRKIPLFAFALLLSSASLGQVLVHEIPSPTANAVGLCWDGSALWVSDYSRSLRRVDPVTGAVTRTITGPVNGSDGLAFENGYLWTVSRVTSIVKVFKVDTTSGNAVDSIPDPTAGWAGGAAWDGSALWFSVYYPNDRIMRVNPATLDTLALFAAPGDQPFGLAWDGTTLWNSSTDTGADRIYRMDPATGAVLWSFVLPPHQSEPSRRPRGLAWDGQYLWVLAYAQSNPPTVKIFKYDVSNANNPDIHFSDSLRNYGSIVVGFPVSWTTNARNVGNAMLRLDSARFASGAAYALLQPVTFPINLAPAAVQSFVIRFDPPAAGSYPDTLRVYSNDPDENPYPIVLRGVGLANEGDIDVFPTVIPFGEVRINPPPVLSTTRPLDIVNLGSGTLTVNSFTLTGDNAFYWDPIPLPLAIDSQATYTTRIWFNPTAVQAYSAVLNIASNDPDEPVVSVILEGFGSDVPVDGGGVLWYFDASTPYHDNSINSVQSLSDVNGDGIHDVIAASGNGLIYCLNGSSTQFADTFWTYYTRADPNHSGVVYYERGMSACPDLTGDGVDEVIIGTSGGSRSVYALSGADGTELWMFDTHIWGGGGWVYEVYPIEDVTGDFVPDVLGCAGDDGSGTGPNRVFALSGASGQMIWNAAPSSAFFTVRTIGDVTGDGIDDVVAGDTDGNVFGYSGTSGASLWSALVGADSPVFALLSLGSNANPGQTTTEDVAVASAYEGVFCLDGGNGAQIWFVETTSTVYELAVGGDVTGDNINEVYFGMTNGRVMCLDGATGIQVWSVTADPNGSANVLSLTTVPDVTGDGVRDIVAGTLGNNVVLLNGWDGSREWATIGIGPASAIDALGVLPDIDRNDSWEILVGNRGGLVQALSGGQLVSDAPSPPMPAVTRYSLGVAYPNPFNARTVIPYALEREGHLRMNVFDVLGRRVAILWDAPQAAGAHEISWNGSSADGRILPSGIYFVQLRTGTFSAASKITLLK
ncbi:choice-of-anchor D domain-containing protein [bacterium]|nr:choice-of-anchor D domain-containing protein [bacterium]MBU1984289.1 choice-of-anchor D domain-containing protein [bacterium]